MIRKASLTLLAVAIALGMLLHRNSPDAAIWAMVYFLPIPYLGLAMAGRYYVSSGGFMVLYLVAAMSWVGYEEARMGLAHLLAWKGIPETHWELVESAGLLLCALGFAAAFACWCLRVARQEDQDDLRWWNDYLD